MKYLPVVLLLIFIAGSVKSQNANRLMRKADSLRRSNNNVTALEIYGQVIDSVLADKTKPSVRWQNLLITAAKLGYDLRRFDLAKKYWNMAYGTRAEKLDDKILFLQNSGIDHIYTFEEKMPSNTYNILNADRCTSNFYKVLIWFHERNLFMQKFTECDTYPPLVVQNHSLADFYARHVRKMMIEEIKPFQKEPAHVTDYSLEIVDKGGKIQKSFNVDYDLMPPDRTYSPTELSTRYKYTWDIYKKNKQTFIGNLLIKTIPEVQKYLDKIDIGSELAKSGKLTN